jgi:hypothetical protein
MMTVIMPKYGTSSISRSDIKMEDSCGQHEAQLETQHKDKIVCEAVSGESPEKLERPLRSNLGKEFIYSIVKITSPVWSSTP